MEAITQNSAADGVGVPEMPEVEVRRGKGRGRAVATEHESNGAAAAIALAVEAILLSVDKAVAPGRIAEAVFRPEAAREVGRERKGEGDEERESLASKAEVAAVDEAIGILNAEYERSGRSFRIESVAGGYRLMTLAAHSAVIAAFKRARLSAKLSRAAVETLAIIAYRQPVTRAELEAIRGVACGEVLKSLMDRRLVTIKGRAEEIGRPILYGTTKQFLDHFGIASLKDLPAPAEVGGGRARDA